MTRRYGKYRIKVPVVDQILDLYVEDEPVINGILYYMASPVLEFVISVRLKVSDRVYLGKLEEANKVQK